MLAVGFLQFLAIVTFSYASQGRAGEKVTIAPSTDEKNIQTAASKETNQTPPVNEVEVILSGLIGKTSLPPAVDIWRANALKLLGVEPNTRFFIYLDKECEKESYDFFLLKTSSKTYTIIQDCDGACAWRTKTDLKNSLDKNICRSLYEGGIPYRDYNGF